MRTAGPGAGGCHDAPSVTRVAAIYDIHGNLPALEAVLEDVRAAGAGRIVVGGDVVPGPMPRESIDCLMRQSVPVQFIRGNGEREILAMMEGRETGAVPESYQAVMRWVAEQLDQDDHALLTSWPSTLRMDIAGLGDVFFCHATPQSDTQIFTSETSEQRLLPLFEGLNADVVVCGHTHMQFERTIGRVRVVNAGSVGMPFGEPGANWLLLGPEIELRRTGYDLERAADRIRRSRYPQAEHFAANDLLRPRSLADALELYSRVELE